MLSMKFRRVLIMAMSQSNALRAMFRIKGDYLERLLANQKTNFNASCIILGSYAF